MVNHEPLRMVTRFPCSGSSTWFGVYGRNRHCHGVPDCAAATFGASVVIFFLLGNMLY